MLSALWYVGAYFRFRRELLASAKEARAEDLAVYSLVAGEPCPRLCRSRAVRTPLLLGVLRPVIFLPDRDYSPAMLRGVLAHEMTHCRRGDVLFKWFAVLVSVLHWFNPVTILLRSELDRACELACDERLLRRMDAGEKQLYGDMLLTLAADRRMPRSVVATSFAVEKRNLKERLYQIMTYKKRGRAALCLALAAMLLLSACGAVVGPARRAEQPDRCRRGDPHRQRRGKKTLNPFRGWPGGGTPGDLQGGHGRQHRRFPWGHRAEHHDFPQARRL